MTVTIETRTKDWDEYKTSALRMSLVHVMMADISRYTNNMVMKGEWLDADRVDYMQWAWSLYNWVCVTDDYDDVAQPDVYKDLRDEGIFQESTWEMLHAFGQEIGHDFKVTTFSDGS